jgi:hypothetical protein
MKKLLFVLLTATVYSIPAARAGDGCVVTIDRTPCEGKETEARKPYSGKNPTEEKQEKAKTEADCIKAAEKLVKIVRKGTLAKKVATIKFDGKDLGTKEDTHACK